MNKKWIRRTLIFLAALCLFPATIADACAAFIIGKDLTTDGSTIFGRTEDFPFWRFKTKNFVVHEAADHLEGTMIVDQSNGFTYPQAAHTFKYYSVPDVTPHEGVYDEHGFNEHGVAVTATVSAEYNDKIAAVDPLVKDGLAESALTTVVLPRVKTAREGIELIAKVLDEKGAAEGNIVVISDKNELWYMEILSGHQYVAIKFPDDKFAVFSNTYFLGTVDLENKEETIASPNVVKVARDADSYVEQNGKFHVALSYAPPLEEGNRSRAYAGIKLFNPDAPITYEDSHYELLQTTDRRLSIADAMAIQRNRFEHLPEFKPSDEAPSATVRPGRGGTIVADPQEQLIYKYPLGNEYVIEGHIYQIKEGLPNELGGVMWLAMGPTRSAPYLPYYGNVSEIYSAYNNYQGQEYHPDSWYWVAANIDKMISEDRELFGTEAVDKWKELERQWIDEQQALDAEYAEKGIGDPAQAQADTNERTLKRAAEVFQQMKALEAEMTAKFTEKYGQAPALPYEKYDLPRPRLTPWEKRESNWVYRKKDGQLAAHEWVQHNNAWYFFTADQKMVTGWHQVGKGWYYFHEGGDMNTAGWYRVGGKWYYFNEGGDIAIGWKQVHDHWYYLNSDGSLATGWLFVDGKWYYLHEGGDMATGWLELEGKWYYLAGNGVLLVNGTHRIGDKAYRFDASGVWLP